eukprot:TRINITY_DN17932_c0_g1_i1.p2 TRINITY_DN17932_c0_g1~~TRINITY_DN17932_c0_g1_i1.p2  ORF type:complete len:179 (-),score=40.98 TRINITY_DN17932_c0_g1_i1:209-745(-)
MAVMWTQLLVFCMFSWVRDVDGFLFDEKPSTSPSGGPLSKDIYHPLAQSESRAEERQEAQAAKMLVEFRKILNDPAIQGLMKDVQRDKGVLMQMAASISKQLFDPILAKFGLKGNMLKSAIKQMIKTAENDEVTQKILQRLHNMLYPEKAKNENASLADHRIKRKDKMIPPRWRSHPR